MAGTLDFRLVVQKLRREFIPAQSARMHEFSSQFLDNQPEIECMLFGQITQLGRLMSYCYFVLCDPTSSLTAGG